MAFLQLEISSNPMIRTTKFMCNILHASKYKIQYYYDIYSADFCAVVLFHSFFFHFLSHIHFIEIHKIQTKAELTKSRFSIDFFSMRQIVGNIILYVIYVSVNVCHVFVVRENFKSNQCDNEQHCQPAITISKRNKSERKIIMCVYHFLRYAFKIMNKIYIRFYYYWKIKNKNEKRSSSNSSNKKNTSGKKWRRKH